MVEGHASFLDQILHLKQEIDKVNARIAYEIQETRELESKLVQCAEEEQELVRLEFELLATLARRDNLYVDLRARRDALRRLNGQMEQNIADMECTNKQMRLNNDSARNEFVVFCREFQQQQDEISRSASPSAKLELLNRIGFLEKEVEAQNTLNKQQAHENGELQRQIYADSSSNHILLADIGQLKAVLRDVEISRRTLKSSQGTKELELERRELQACISALRSGLRYVQQSKGTKTRHSSQSQALPEVAWASRPFALLPVGLTKIFPVFFCDVFFFVFYFVLLFFFLSCGVDQSDKVPDTSGGCKATGPCCHLCSDNVPSL